MRVNRNYVLTEYVLNENDCKTKKRVKEEKIENCDCGPPTEKSFVLFFRLCRT